MLKACEGNYSAMALFSQGSILSRSSGIRVVVRAFSKPELRIDPGGGYDDPERSGSQYRFAVRYECRIFKNRLGILEDGTIVSADFNNTSFANLKKFGQSVLLTSFS